MIYARHNIGRLKRKFGSDTMAIRLEI
ncbi:hypothetical protein SPHINGOAX6_30111 [Sphingomonas sp. AX6]|nr:hypothetical protein SPHINGOAX6_30111 [Sphingomonas sp. AX6]